MIDFETLAETRAKELGQSEREWIEALMQPSFNEFSTYLSDGEIDEFVHGVDSPVTLTIISGAFLKGYREGSESAYSDFHALVKGSSLNVRDGLDFFCQIALWERLQGAKIEYQRKLDSLREFIQKNSSYEKGQDISLWIK